MRRLVYDMRIDRVVVTNVGGAPVDADTLRTHLTQAIARELSAAPLPFARSIRTATRVDVPSLSVGPPGSTARLGQALGRAVAGALGGRRG